MKMEDVFSKDYIDGFKKGIEMCNNIARRNGFKIKFPNIDTLEVKKDEK